METIRVSQSEVSTYTNCPKKFVYAHVDKLEPIKQAEHLSVGTLGHYFLELFLKGLPRQEAMEAIATKDPFLFPKIARQLNYWVDNVWPKFDGKLEVVATEVTEFLKLGIITDADGKEYMVEFPFTIDAVMRGKKSRQISLWDHKFVSQFYDDSLLATAKQMRLYAVAFGKVYPDMQPTRAFYNMISTKNTNHNVTKFTEINISNEHMNRVLFANQTTAAMELAKIKVDNLRDQRYAADIHTCKFCPFLKLCTAELSGEPIQEIRNILKLNYRKNSYGY